MEAIEKTKKEYEDLKIQILKSNLEIFELLKDENVKRYIELESLNKKYKEKFENISLQLEIENMKNCSHVFVISSKDKGYDGHRHYSHECYYCLKCGLDTRYDVFDMPFESLTPIQREMSGIFYLTAKNGLLIKCLCHPELAKKIYEGIKKNNPNISDKNLIKYFKTAHHNIVNKCEKKNIKNLGLHPGYENKF